MIHLGDITKIKGNEAPVVDCVIGGSPCQGLSQAGKRAGLDDDRSGLYIEQIRVIKEMRAYDRLCGRTGVDVRCRYMVWENVPGAFSTNNGLDFAAVLEEAIRVAEPKAPSVPVPEKGWPTAGCIYDEMGKWSVAWRVMDAQYWGVPQRRRRICLVADFNGLNAPKIVFGEAEYNGETEQDCRNPSVGHLGAEPRPQVQPVTQGLPGNTDESKPKGQETAGDAGAGSSGAGKAVGFPLGFRPENVRCYDETATTLCNGTRPGFTTGVIQPVIAVDQGGGKSRVHTYDGVSPTLTCTNDGAPAVTYCIEGNGSRPSHKGDGYCESDTMYTLNSTEQHAVAYTYDARGNGDGQMCATLTGDHQNRVTDYTSVVLEPVGYEMQAFGKYKDSGKASSLKARDYKDATDLVVSSPASFYPQMKAESQCFRQDGVSNTLVNGTNPGFQNAVVTPIAIDRAFFNQGKNAQYEPQCYTDGTVSTLVSKGPSAVAVRHIVRRLTPCECELLQGFPKGWTDIGEWIDTKGKKHKEADSPRYKALGNSIALPPWKWTLKRLCACYERDATMASLFDGIGGFPLIWEQINGKGSCLWASEIEEFPMAVTKLRFGGSNHG